jgi:hypothetical protein
VELVDEPWTLDEAGAELEAWTELEATEDNEDEEAAGVEAE